VARARDGAGRSEAVVSRLPKAKHIDWDTRWDTWFGSGNNEEATTSPWPLGRENCITANHGDASVCRRCKVVTMHVASFLLRGLASPSVAWHEP
jgi:hypothetical protein